MRWFHSHAREYEAAKKEHEANNILAIAGTLSFVSTFSILWLIHQFVRSARHFATLYHDPNLPFP